MFFDICPYYVPSPVFQSTFVKSANYVHLWNMCFWSCCCPWSRSHESCLSLPLLDWPLSGSHLLCALSAARAESQQVDPDLVFRDPLLCIRQRINEYSTLHTKPALFMHMKECLLLLYVSYIITLNCVCSQVNLYNNIIIIFSISESVILNICSNCFILYTMYYTNHNCIHL